MESKQEEKFILKQAEEDLKKKQEKLEEKEKNEKAEVKAEGKSEAKAGAKPEAKKTAEKPKEKPKEAPAKEEKKREIVLERLYTIPIKLFAQGKPRGNRYMRSAHYVRQFAAKHMKAPLDKIRIQPKVWETLTRSGRNKLFKKLKVKTSKDKEGIVLVELAQ